MNNVLCKCGHLEKAHNPRNNIICIECFYAKLKLGKDPVNDTNFFVGECRIYNQDNLSYIEQLAKEKGLV